MGYKRNSDKRTYWRKWYKANRSRVIKAAAIRNVTVRRRNAEWLYQYLLLHPCVDCGERDPVVLECDHVHGKKDRTISDALKCCSLEKIKREIELCVVRCANCHRRKTAKQFNWRARTKRE